MNGKMSETSLKEFFQRMLLTAWDKHPLTCITTATGFVLALLIIFLGFWATLLILLLTGGGFAFGHWIETDERRFFDFCWKIDEFWRSHKGNLD